MPSKFGGIPVEDAPQRSKFGGIPVDDTPVPDPRFTAPDAGAQMRADALSRVPPELSGHMTQKNAPSALQHLNFPPEMADIRTPEAGPGQQIVQGVERAAEPGFDNKAAGASKAIRGLGSAAASGALPMLAGGLVAAPVATTLGLAGGGAASLGGGKLARLGAQKIGAGPGAQDLAQDAGEATGALVSPPALKGIGKVVGAPAGPIAETALGVRKLDRAYGKNPGRAILDETSGYSPEAVADSARSKLKTLNADLEGKAAAATTPASLTPALSVINNAESNALSKNAANTVNQLAPMRAHLTRQAFTGRPLAPIQTPAGLLQLKRGFGDEFIHNWNPETMEGVRGTAAQAYHALGQELNRTVDGAEGLNQRISSLIPVAKRAESVGRNAGPVQQALGRFARPTGALVGAVTGAIEGGKHFGIPGAIGGAIAGLGVPELISSPTAQMVAARGLNAAGKSLQTPAAATAARIVPLITSARKREK